jgi:hypothetical protein
MAKRRRSTVPPFAPTEPPPVLPLLLLVLLLLVVLLLLLALVELAWLELVALAPPAPEPPHTFVLGMQSSACWPSAVVSVVHARSLAHGDDDEQSGAQ